MLHLLLHKTIDLCATSYGKRKPRQNLPSLGECQNLVTRDLDPESCQVATALKPNGMQGYIKGLRSHIHSSG